MDTTMDSTQPFKCLAFNYLICRLLPRLGDYLASVVTHSSSLVCADKSVRVALGFITFSVPLGILHFYHC